ncbi:MAG: DUF4159 domain-containing protein [Acidobacteria bacterium]|nr:DUF4159 domain-containing protein [Acidobacteriota bacterium]
MEAMRNRRVLIGAALLVVTVAGASAYQRRRSSNYEWEMQNPAEDPLDALEPGEFSFARLRYRSVGGWRRGSWGTDANKAERVFIQGVRRLTRVNARSVEEIIDVEDDNVYRWPWLYAVEVGHWRLDEPHAARLRQYLDRGGFLMVDDFHGSYEWAVFEASLRKIFPDRTVVDLDDGDPMFHVLYDLNDRFQVPGRQYIWSGSTSERDGYEAKWRAVLDDKNRVQVLICHNMDLGDAWEWADDPQYPEKFASLAYRIGINAVVYSMTH